MIDFLGVKIEAFVARSRTPIVPITRRPSITAVFRSSRSSDNTKIARSLIANVRMQLSAKLNTLANLVGLLNFKTLQPEINFVSNLSSSGGTSGPKITLRTTKGTRISGLNNSVNKGS